MSSIFEAATLIVYKVPGRDPAQVITNVIGRIWQENPDIRDDFQTSRSLGQGAVHITLPLAVHEADHDAWKHLEHLMGKLCEKNIDCHWATSFTKDRSRALSYVVSLKNTDRTRTTHLAKKQRKGQFSNTHDRLAEDDPRLLLKDFRVRIINSALEKLGIQSVEFDWAHRKHDYQKGNYLGNITLNSPVDVGKCLEKPHHDDIIVDSSRFRIHFDKIFGLITPTTCTTIGLVVVGDGCELYEHKIQVQELLEKYNLVNGTDATIDNVRMSTEYSKYLLCDPCDIITAQGLCELPMPNRRFFRQMFFANANPANYTPEYSKAYDKEAGEAHSIRYRSAGRTCPARSGSMVPLTIKIGPKAERTKSTPLQDLRQERLITVCEYHRRLRTK
jgi:hypothetical protein